MFKRCSCCNTTWSDVHSLVTDDHLTLLGVQDDPDPAHLLVGLQHTCGTTLYVALATLVTAGVGQDGLRQITWPATDGLPHGPQRLMGEALSATTRALSMPRMRDSV